MSAFGASPARQKSLSSALEALPEELRIRLREGRFDAEVLDDEWQVIPSAWVAALVEEAAASA